MGKGSFVAIFINRILHFTTYVLDNEVVSNDFFNFFKVVKVKK